MPGPQQTSQQPSTTAGSSSVSNTSSQSGTVATSADGQQQMNTLSLCKVGAETVQDIVSKTIDLFSLLKQLQVCYF